MPDCRDMLVLDLLDTQMCVEGTHDNSQACEGDSGGPISKVNRANRGDLGVWELAGVVSFGASAACGAKVPLVVTRINEANVYVLLWLKRIIGGDLPAYPTTVQGVWPALGPMGARAPSVAAVRMAGRKSSSLLSGIQEGGAAHRPAGGQGLWWLRRG